MLGITATHTVLPTQINTYRQLMAELAEETRKESGCKAYHVLQSDNDPRVHLLIECWEDRDALDRHTKTPHFQKIVPQLPALYAEPEVSSWYQVLI